jgi:hypothetical protein
MISKEKVASKMPDSFDATLNIATQLTQRVGLNVAATYNPVMRDSFYALVPAEFKFYYTNVVRRCLNWYHGYVPEVHAPSVGIPSTNIGTMIVKEVTKLIYGGEVFFENKYAEKTNKKREYFFQMWSSILVNMMQAMEPKNKPKIIVVPAISEAVFEFIEYAKANPDLTFTVTRIGCGYAHYADSNIAPLFKGAPKNCQLPSSWRERLKYCENPVQDTL